MALRRVRRSHGGARRSDGVLEVRVGDDRRLTVERLGDRLDDVAANAVAAAVAGEAPGLTTGQLRALLRRAVLALDPDAAAKRRAQGERQARVEVWAEPSGTAALAGRDLPPAAVVAADKRITSLALALKAAGVDGTMDQLISTPVRRSEVSFMWSMWRNAALTARHT